MKPRVLVAGIGNIFFGDDAFGPAVLARLLGQEPPDGARCEDYGIRGLHLAYELLSGYDAAVLVDAVARGDVPGTLYVIEPDASVAAREPDAHRMDLGSVLGFVRMLGGEAPPITIVGCEPASLGEGDELSAPVLQAVEAALPLVRRVVRERIARIKEQACEV